jgi:hypothetical protein
MILCAIGWLTVISGGGCAGFVACEPFVVTPESAVVTLPAMSCSASSTLRPRSGPMTTTAAAATRGNTRMMCRGRI